MGAEGTGGPEGPAEMDGAVVAVAVAVVAAGVAAVVAAAVAVAASASAGGAAAREGAVSVRVCGVWQASKAPGPWHMGGVSSGARGKYPAPAEPGAVSPKDVDHYYLAWFNPLYRNRLHVVATQTREPASRSMPCTTCAVLATLAA